MDNNCGGYCNNRPFVSIKEKAKIKMSGKKKVKKKNKKREVNKKDKIKEFAGEIVGNAIGYVPDIIASS